MLKGLFKLKKSVKIEKGFFCHHRYWQLWSQCSWSTSIIAEGCLLLTCVTSLSNIWYHHLMLFFFFLHFYLICCFESCFISRATQLEPISNISTVLLYFFHPVHLLQACVVCTGSVECFSFQKLTPYCEPFANLQLQKPEAKLQCYHFIISS